jgi:hypothetical protein
MIYIITPYMQDFKRMCEQNNLHYHSGRSSNDVLWVNHVCQLFGRAIFSHDKIIKGDQYYCFETSMLDHIESELKMRLLYGRNSENAIQKQSSNARDVCKPTSDSKALGKGNAKHKSASRKAKEEKKES